MTLRLLIVGEGPRDEACVPRLVELILETTVDSSFEPWVRLHRKGARQGLGRKLLYSMRQLKDRGLQALIATANSDRPGSSGKLKELAEARAAEKAAGKAVPTALGAAIPHVEAWLIDDRAAVRQALHLPTDLSDLEIPSPTTVLHPQDELDGLIAQSDPRIPVIEALARIAAALEIERCENAVATGFSAFCADVQAELAPLTRT